MKKVFRTTAAALVAAAVVASCASGGGVANDPAVAVPPTVETSAANSAGAATTSTPPLTTAAAPATSAAPATPTTVFDLEAALASDLFGDGPLKIVNTEAAIPVTIRIPSIEVEAPIIGLGLREDGAIEVPERTEETGWWQGGPEPGEPGPAVILGHLDSRVGPAVFYRLRELDPGDEIHIDREDGTTVTYVVEASERHGKDVFPTEAVYGATEQPTLRLVTCGGEFDYDIRSYEDNFIVFATIV